MARDTRTWKTANHLIGDLDNFVQERRNQGWSWHRITADLRDKTAGIVDLNRETLRIWYRTEGDGGIAEMPCSTCDSLVESGS